MAAKRPVAPDTPIRSFPTPNINDLVVVLDVDSRLPGYKPLEYGTPHPDQTRFKGAKLVYQEPLDGTDRFVRRIYATDRADQDTYNYAVNYSSGSAAHPVYVRSYIELRSDYKRLPDGTPDSVFKDAILVSEEMAPVEGELSSLYVRVTRVFETLPGPLLTGQRYDESFDLVIPFTQQVVSSATESIGDERTDIEPRDVQHSLLRAIDVEKARTKFLAEEWAVSAYVNMELPDVLESVTAVRTRARSYGKATSTGNNYSLRASGSASETIDFRWRIRNGYTGPVPATRHVFFLDKSNASFATVAARVEAEAFPRLFPEPVVITSVSGSVTKDASASASFGEGSGASVGSGESFSSNLSSSVTTIPPTLHSSFNIGTVNVDLGAAGDPSGTGQAVVNSASALTFVGAFSVATNEDDSPSITIPATSPEIFPPGDYIVSIDTESYKYGLVRVTTVVAHVTEDYTGTFSAEGD
jgi:hypothetical protein